MSIPSKVIRFEVERRKGIKMHKSQESAVPSLRAFLCLFGPSARRFEKYCSRHVREMILDSCNCHPRFAQATSSDSCNKHLSCTSMIEMYYFKTIFWDFSQISGDLHIGMYVCTSRYLIQQSSLFLFLCCSIVGQNQFLIIDIKN